MSDSEKDKKVDLPKNWVQRVSKSRNGKVYYFNTKTRESVWHLEEVLKIKSPKSKAKETPKKRRPEIRHTSTPNVAESRLKNLQSSFNGTKSNPKLPDKALHKIQSATSFKKRNLAEDRLKTLQSNLKKDQLLKEELLTKGPVLKKTKSDNPSPMINNNNNNKPAKDETPKRKKNDSALTEETNIMTKYREFVAQLKSPKKEEKDANKKEVAENISVNKDDSVSTSANHSLIDSLKTEPMDWEYTSDDFSTTTLDTTNNDTTNKSVTVPLDNFETMEQYLNYKNLLNDEQEIDQKYFYVIVDTNVFISNLDFIEKLIKINFKTYGHPVIIVPYIVLQELDKIKSRFESKFTTLSLKAKSAIHYLNDKLKDHHKQFCGQSAKDDAQKLISITSQDDDIVNCALQVKEKAKDAVILLSNDKNLRNKVLVNGINTYSMAELEASRDSLKFFTPNS